VVVSRVVRFELLLSSDSILKVVIALSALSNGGVIVLEVIHIDCCLVHGLISTIISLFEHLGGKFVLTAFERILFRRTFVKRVLQATLIHPVCLSSKACFTLITIEIGVCSSTKHIGSQLLVLAVFPVLALVHIHLFARRCLICRVNCDILPVGIRSHETAITFV